MQKCPECKCSNSMFRIDKCMHCGWIKGEDKGSPERKNGRYVIR